MFYFKFIGAIIISPCRSIISFGGENHQKPIWSSRKFLRQFIMCKVFGKFLAIISLNIKSSPILSPLPYRS